MKMILILTGIFAVSFAQEIYELEPVVVTATRYPKNIMELARTITIIDSSEIIKYSSLSEILEGIAGIDTKIRGDGIQADPSIRGATFQQVLIMIDGIRVNDPQTAHHNLNIPVPLNEIERIEILYGPASSLYGSDACGGVINIITKKSAGIAGGIGFGSFGYKDCFGKFATNKVSIDFETKSSAGHEPGYEYSQYNIAAKFNTSITNNYKFTILGGYLNKSFGAKNFYAPYPSWEKNQAFFINLNNQWFISSYFMLNPILSFRTHIDTFILDRTDPTFYANRHQSFTYGGQLIGNFDAREIGFFSAGTEIFIDSLSSTRLKERKLTHFAGFVQWEEKFLKNSAIITSGIRNDHYSNFGSNINPHLSIAYWRRSFLKLFCMAGGSFRVPSFTELYYQDPANLGDSLLKPERARDYEIGILNLFKNFQSQFTIFLRETEEDIDWVKKNNETVWQAHNIGHTRFYGIESSLGFAFGSRLHLKNDFSYIHSIKQLPEEYLSKYSLQVPKTTVTTKIALFSISELNLAWSYYEKTDTRLILNLICHKEFHILKKVKLVSLVSITNLFDRIYQDYQDVPLPGRSMRMGVSLTDM